MKMRRNIAALWVLSLGLTGCNVVGPHAISNGRATYASVINQTEDEQVLTILVRQRHGETFGMLAVSSVTASIRVATNVGANVGIGPSSDYAGNLVPLSAGMTYEENPTISYAPVRGSQLIERLLAPLTPEHALLLSRMSTEQTEAFRFVLRRVNGLANPIFCGGESPSKFDRFVELFASLRDAGSVDIVEAKDQTYSMILHDYPAESRASIVEMFTLLGLKGAPRDVETVTVPVRFAVGGSRADGIDFETPSALEILQAAAGGVELPSSPSSSPPPETSHAPRIMSVRVSATRPPDAVVAVPHRGSWYYIDPHDTVSKQGFFFIRTLIGIRLDSTTAGSGVPVLTVPVSR